MHRETLKTNMPIKLRIDVYVILHCIFQSPCPPNNPTWVDIKGLHLFFVSLFCISSSIENVFLDFISIADAVNPLVCVQFMLSSMDDKYEIVGGLQ